MRKKFLIFFIVILIITILISFYLVIQKYNIMSKYQKKIESMIDTNNYKLTIQSNYSFIEIYVRGDKYLLKNGNASILKDGDHQLIIDSETGKTEEIPKNSQIKVLTDIDSIFRNEKLSLLTIIFKTQISKEILNNNKCYKIKFFDDESNYRTIYIEKDSFKPIASETEDITYFYNIEENIVSDKDFIVKY